MNMKKNVRLVLAILFFGANVNASEIDGGDADLQNCYEAGVCIKKAEVTTETFDTTSKNLISAGIQGQVVVNGTLFIFSGFATEALSVVGLRNPKEKINPTEKTELQVALQLNGPLAMVWIVGPDGTPIEPRVGKSIVTARSYQQTIQLKNASLTK